MSQPVKLSSYQLRLANNTKYGITPPQKKQTTVSNPSNTPVIDILKTPSITNSNTSNTSINQPGIFQILNTSSIVNLEPSTNLINQPKGLFDDLIRTSNNSNIQPNNMYIPNNISNNASDSKTNNVVTTQEPKKSYASYIVGFVIIYLVFLRKK